MKKVLRSLGVLFIGLGATFSFANTQNDAEKLKNQLIFIINLIIETDESKEDAIKAIMNSCAESHKNTTTQRACKLVVEEWETKPNSFELVEVIDGDTIKVKNGEENINVRLIGIDAPENTKARYGYRECYGEESKNHLIKLLQGTNQVAIELDSSQGEYDMYGRILGYIWIGDKNINQQMLADGYAREYTYKKDYNYSTIFKQSEETAMSEALGLWSAQTCNGSRIDIEDSQESTKGENKEESSINSSSNTSTNNSNDSTPCGDYTWHRGPRGGCYRYSGDTKQYDVTKMCCR